MRKIILLATAAALSACGATSDASSTAGFPGFRPFPAPTLQVAPNWGEVALVKFSRDSRPADGPLVEVILTKNARNSYDATLHHVTAGFPPPVVDTTDQLAVGLTCVNGFADEQGSLTDIVCSHDYRPVDGALVQITFQLDGDGTYTARKVVTPSGFGTGDTTPVVTDIDSFLTLSIPTQN
jgi:hypothetical protein